MNLQKRVFVSVSSKLLCLITLVLMLVGAGFSWISLSRLEANVEQHQLAMQKQGEQQFNLQLNQLKSQLTVWLESFSDIKRNDETVGFSHFIDALKQHYQSLQIHFNVNDIWLVSNNQLLFSTRELPDIINETSNLVIKQQTPIEAVNCFEQCQQVISIPVLNNRGEIAALTITASLVDVFYSMKNVLGSDLAIFTFNDKEAVRFSGNSLLASSKEALSTEFIDIITQEYAYDDLLNKGLSFSLEHKYYQVNFLHLFEHNGTVHSLALFDDITSFELDNAIYRRDFLISVLVIFIAVTLLVYLIITPFTSRLIRLSEVLPKLARKEFVQFRQVNLGTNPNFIDEFDLLARSSTALSYELEQLNLEIEQKTAELETIAMYDPLTGLPNRNMLNQILHRSIQKLSDNSPKLALLFLDLDNFKKVNDSHGHGEGDQLLIEAAQRICTNINDHTTVCRFGGDEFVIILENVISISDVIDLAENILAQFRTPIHISNSIFYVSTSIGMVITDDETIKPEELISQADIAMYEAKESGGGQYHVFYADMFKRIAHSVYMEGEVRQALLKQQFSLSLQPQLSACNNKLHGFEALLRWRHPERGMIPPDDFIPLIETSEHMVELGYWVMRRCFELMTVFKALGHSELTMAINLTAGQFLDPQLKSYLESLLSEFKLCANHFELELTEQTLVKDMDVTIDVMNELKELGFSFAIDDFGTGYSSLAYLKKMPVDVIKIDRSFVNGMLENKADWQIIMSTIAMVKNLELTVVAEGVETKEQLINLAENDCDIIQGYYFSKPIPDVDVFDFVSNNLIDGYWKLQ